MGKVQYNQKGYVGTSMSVRATRAYEAGEKPLSKFTAADKNALNELIQKYAPETGLVIQNVPQLKTIMRKWGSVSHHHAGKYAATTEFYHLCGLFDLSNPDQWEDDVTDENIRIFTIRMNAAARLMAEGAL